MQLDIDCAAKHQLFTRSDREGNQILLLKLEVFFERALKALSKEIPSCYLPSIDEEIPECRSVSNLRRMNKLHDRACNDNTDIYFLNIYHVLLLALQKIGITRNLDNASIDLKDPLVYRVNSSQLDQSNNRPYPLISELSHVY